MDLPISVGDNSGKVEGKQLFKCLPRHGKIVRLSDIHSVMNPRVGQMRCIVELNFVVR